MKQICGTEHPQFSSQRNNLGNSRSDWDEILWKVQMSVWFCRHSTVSHHWNVNLVQKIPAWLIVQIKSDTLTKVKTKTCWAFERRSSGRISWRDLSFYRFFRIKGSINRHISRFWIRSFADCAKWHMHAAIIFFVGAFLLGLLYFQCLVYSRLKKWKTYWKRVTQWWSLHFIALLLTLAGRLVKDSFNHKSPSIPADTSI